MILSPNYPNRAKDNDISFPSLRCWNPVTKTITIAAQVHGKRVSCRVSIKDLKVKYRVFKNDPMAIAAECRSEIENAARKLIENNSFEKDGSILILYNDL